MLTEREIKLQELLERKRAANRLSKRRSWARQKAKIEYLREENKKMMIFDQVFKALSDPVVTVLQNGQITCASASFFHHFKFTRDDVAGKKIEDFITNESKEEFRNYFQEQWFSLVLGSDSECDSLGNLKETKSKGNTSTVDLSETYGDDTRSSSSNSICGMSLKSNSYTSCSDNQQGEQKISRDDEQYSGQETENLSPCNDGQISNYERQENSNSKSSDDIQSNESPSPTGEQIIIIGSPQSQEDSNDSCSEGGLSFDSNSVYESIQIWMKAKNLGKILCEVTCKKLSAFDENIFGYSTQETDDLKEKQIDLNLPNENEKDEVVIVFTILESQELNIEKHSIFGLDYWESNYAQNQSPNKKQKMSK